MRTDAVWFSHSRVSLPVVPPRGSSVYFRFSTGPSGLLMVIFTRPRSCVLSYLVPHWPVCLLIIRTHASGSDMSTNSVYFPAGTLSFPAVIPPSFSSRVAPLAPARQTGYVGSWLMSPPLPKICPARPLTLGELY